MEITIDDIKSKGLPLLLRWGGKTPYPDESKYALNPGWKLPEQLDSFFTRIDEQTSILKDLRLIQMNTLDLDIDYMDAEVNLEDIKALKNYPDDSQRVPGEQIQDIYAFKESVPEFDRKALHVKRTVAWTEVAETFLDENLENEEFLFKMAGLVLPKLGLSIEQKITYGIYDPTRPNGRDAYDSVDGIFQQLRYIDRASESGTTEPQGFGSAVSLAKGSVLKQMMEKIEEYEAQDGNDSNARFYVSKVLYNKILREITTRETDWGDVVIRNGADLTIFNTPIRKVDFLNPLKNPQTRNNWGHLGLICDPTSIFCGVYNGDGEPDSNITSRTTYEHKTLNYLTSWQVAFDVLIHWPQDVLGFECIDGATGSLAVSVVDSSKSPIEGATVNIYSVDNPDVAYATEQTTNSAGNVSFEGVEYGKYNIVVTSDNYKKAEAKDVIVNDTLEIQTIKMVRS